MDEEQDQEQDQEQEQDYALDKWDEFLDDFALLIEGGFVGAKQLDETSSMRLFKAAEVINPKSAAPVMGFGHVALNKMDLKVAYGFFEKALEMEPDNYLALCFMGICNLLIKDKAKKGEKMIQEAVEKSTDDAVKNLGNIFLDWAKKEQSKKSKSPYEI